MMKNPVLLVGRWALRHTAPLLFSQLFGDAGTGSLRTYNMLVAAILLLPVLFANFAESMPRPRQGACASLKKAQKNTQPACFCRWCHAGGAFERAEEGDVRPGSGRRDHPGRRRVVEGIATVDESAITGESAPVMRESGGDFARSTGGTTVFSTGSGWKFPRPRKPLFDRMIALVEGASRKKTPNEIALNTRVVS
jgi:K+-transporting ATPase ATPase B chain